MQRPARHQWAEAEGWWLANCSAASIADRLGVSVQAVAQYAQRYWGSRPSAKGRPEAPDFAEAVVTHAAARWGQPRPSPDDIVSAHVDCLHEPRSRVWYAEWARLMDAVRRARSGYREHRQGRAG